MWEIITPFGVQKLKRQRLSLLHNMPDKHCYSALPSSNKLRDADYTIEHSVDSTKQQAIFASQTRILANNTLYLLYIHPILLLISQSHCCNAETLVQHVVTTKYTHHQM